VSLAARIRDARERRGLRQKDVADALGVHKNTVARWERGEMGFHPAMREKVEAWIGE
jgi:transcriptional regulator with XRE-family HTH domain